MAAPLGVLLARIVGEDNVVGDHVRRAMLGELLGGCPPLGVEHLVTFAIQPHEGGRRGTQVDRENPPDVMHGLQANRIRIVASGTYPAAPATQHHRERAVHLVGVARRAWSVAKARD